MAGDAWGCDFLFGVMASQSKEFGVLNDLKLLYFATNDTLLPPGQCLSKKIIPTNSLQSIICL